jgi:CheY-like chemotaxis protein
VAHILLVDDNIALAENLAEILLDAGHTSAIFHHPAEALSCFHEMMYDAAILDYKMPGFDGVALYTQLKQKDPALRAMIVSAYADDDCLHIAKQQGIQGVLTKPIDISAFFDTLSTLLQTA